MAKWGDIKCPRCAEADDLVQAAVAAALREAVLQVHSSVPGHMLVGDTDRICDAIFALITPDAQAALDRVVAAERGRIADLERRLKLWVPQNISETGRWPIRKGGE